MTISTKPLTENFGVELSGFDPNNLSGSNAEKVRDLFEQHHFLLIRNAGLDESQHVALINVVGPISRADAIMKDGRKFTHISNQHADGRLPTGELLYHSDHMFLDTTLRGISLYALAVPNIGGETRFRDAAAAYNDLPDDLKRRIEGQSIRHVYDYDKNTGDRAPKVEELSANSDTAVHPIVYLHPSTGKKVLFVSKLFAVEVVGLPKQESDALLEELFSYLENRPDDYVHKWSVDDCIIWDNRVLQHARNDFPPTEKRALRRVPFTDMQNQVAA